MMINILYYKTGFDLSYEREYIVKNGYKGVTLHEVAADADVSMFDAANEVRADAILIVYEAVTRQILERIPTLKLVAVPSIGYNNIDIRAAKELGIRVVHLSSYCEEEVAEHTVSLALDLARKITFLDRDVREGKWEFAAGYEPHRLKGKIFGLVFFGKIPKRMVPMLKGFGMSILVYAPTKSAEEIEAWGAIKAKSLEELLQNSDFVSLHTPLTESTFHMIGEEAINRMKNSAFLINTSRGAIVDEKALYRALSEGRILGAAVDVIENETAGKTKLSTLPNAIVTPHAAFYSEESLRESRDKSLQHILDWCLLGQEPEDAIV